MLEKSTRNGSKVEGFKTGEAPIAPINRPNSASTKTIIGEHISINGDMRGEGDLVMEGSVKGSVNLEKYHLTVGSKGQVDAQIHVDWKDHGSGQSSDHQGCCLQRRNQSQTYLSRGRGLSQGDHRT